MFTYEDGELIINTIDPEEEQIYKLSYVGCIMPNKIICKRIPFDSYVIDWNGGGAGGEDGGGGAKGSNPSSNYSFAPGKIIFSNNGSPSATFKVFDSPLITKWNAFSFSYSFVTDQTMYPPIYYYLTNSDGT